MESLRIIHKDGSKAASDQITLNVQRGHSRIHAMFRLNKFLCYFELESGGTSQYNFCSYYHQKNNSKGLFIGKSTLMIAAVTVASCLLELSYTAFNYFVNNRKRGSFLTFGCSSLGLIHALLAYFSFQLIHGVRKVSEYVVCHLAH